MRKKVGLIVMVLAILLMANLSLNANAQPGSTTPISPHPRNRNGYYQHTDTRLPSGYK
jgi:hypothetical protein